MKGSFRPPIWPTLKKDLDTIIEEHCPDAQALEQLVRTGLVQELLRANWTSVDQDALTKLLSRSWLITVRASTVKVSGPLDNPRGKPHVLGTGDPERSGQWRGL